MFLHQIVFKFGLGIHYDIEDDAEEGDLFGSSLATGDFNKDGIWDLAIGVPREEIDMIDMAGGVNVIYGSPKGLASVQPPSMNVRHSQFWSQITMILKMMLKRGDLFGSSLATGDFNKDGIWDLAIGVPREEIDMIDMAGGVNVIYGSSADFDLIILLWRMVGMINSGHKIPGTSRIMPEYRSFWNCPDGGRL